ncbi:MAG: hypothetical protein H7Y86_14935 [Rhizobacter sp.]|nr:hypothetical protein [Ferruginibacter sp.]
MEKIEIPLSRRKMFLFLLGSLVFFFIGMYFIVELVDIQQPYNTLIIKIIGGLFILLSGLMSIYSVYKIFDRNPGLIIDENGIYDNSSASAIGFIPWNEIVDLEMLKVQSIRLIFIHVKQPDFFLAKVTGFKKSSLKATMDIYDSPLVISTVSLKYSFNIWKNY